ncbi:MAG: hypothetical protein WCS34_02235 [Bacteroidales bacterium]
MFYKKHNKYYINLKEGREWILLLTSLFLALFIWFIHNLSSEYSDYLEFSVKVQTDMPGRKNIAFSNNILIVRGKSTGFKLLKNKISNPSNLNLHINSKYFHHQTHNIYYIKTSDIRMDIERALSDITFVENLRTDTLFFTFPSVVHKKVAVIPKSSISLHEQYMMIDKIKMDPDSIIIYGDENYLSRINAVFTMPITFRQLSKSKEGMIKILPMKSIRFSQKQVLYSIKVDRFVEEYIKNIPLRVINLPEGGNIKLLPSRINLVYRRSFGYKKALTADDFDYVVDYNDYINAIDSKVIPKALLSPQSVYYTEIDPPYVECVYTKIN